MKSGSGRRGIQVLVLFLAGMAVPCVAQPRASVDSTALDAAFRTCVALPDHPLAAELMRTVFDKRARDAFAEGHVESVRGLSFDRSNGYATATATLKDGVSVAGLTVRSVYASTCELECALSVWGLEFGALSAKQQSALRKWVASAPTTHTDFHGDVKVQLNTTADGQTVLVCDVSG